MPRIMRKINDWLSDLNLEIQLILGTLILFIYKQFKFHAQLS